MAGYSGTPLAQKLGIKPGALVGLQGAPSGFRELLEPLPEAVQLEDAARGKGPFQVVIAFTKAESALTRLLPDLRARLDPSGGLWIAWPKRASGVATDLTEDVVRRHALANKLVDNKVCAIDDTWSGLRLVIRVADRPKTEAKAKAKTKPKRQ